MKNLKYRNLMLIATLFISACGSTTSITSSYKAPGVNQIAYKKVFVSALTATASVRQTVENSIAQYLGTKGVAVVKSTDVFPPDFHSSGNDKNKDTVLSRIRATNCDGILTTALINKETEVSYVQGSAYGATFGGYYGYGYGRFYSPGYYQTEKVYYIQTNLFDAKTEKLVWSAQSKTYDPSSLDDFLQGYEKAIAEQMVKDGLVAPGSK
jgi:hypothetical protein